MVTSSHLTLHYTVTWNTLYCNFAKTGDNRQAHAFKTSSYLDIESLLGVVLRWLMARCGLSSSIWSLSTVPIVSGTPRSRSQPSESLWSDTERRVRRAVTGNDDPSPPGQHYTNFVLLSTLLLRIIHVAVDMTAVWMRTHNDAIYILSIFISYIHLSRYLH